MQGNMLFIGKEKLHVQWSPKQLSGWLKKEGYRDGAGHEAMYRYVGEDRNMGGIFYKNLETVDKKYTKRSKNTAGRG